MISSNVFSSLHVFKPLHVVDILLYLMKIILYFYLEPLVLVIQVRST